MAMHAVLVASCGDDRAAPSSTPTPLPSSTQPRPTPTTLTSTPAPANTQPPAPTRTASSGSAPSASPTATPSAAPTPTPINDTLDAEQDNGTEGRNPFNNPVHVRPLEACADALRATDQSLVIRVLPAGPTRPDGALAFTSGVCIYLPPGYVGGALSYPVLYLLHGGGGDQADWVTYGGIRAIMDAAIAADATSAAIVVMPDGDDAQWYDGIDRSIQNERYVLDHLVAYVDRHFRTIAARDGRAIDGLSNGGYGAMHLAAKAPDRFVVAGAMSANLAALSFSGLGDAGSAPAYRHGSLPIDLAGNLDGIDLTMDIGTICITDHERDNCLTWRFEQIFVPANREFVAGVRAVRDEDDGVLEYRESEGGHSWTWWPLWLRERHLPFLLARLADPRPADAPIEPAPAPPAFRYRSIAPAFSVWGYEVQVERAVREFLDLRDVRADGLVVQGSGRVVIRTAARYEPGRAYAVSGTGGADQRAIADSEGRLTFRLDLGPSHQHEQYTAEATALEAAGNYWVVRSVVIDRRLQGQKN